MAFKTIGFKALSVSLKRYFTVSLKRFRIAHSENLSREPRESSASHRLLAFLRFAECFVDVG